MSFLYDLPTPVSINFQHSLTDPSGARTGQLAAANAAREAMRTVLKECQRESGNRDWFRAVKVIEDYLPHLLGLLKAIEADILLMNNEVVFGWRSTLSSRRLRTAPRISLPSFHYELVCVLLTLALAISNTTTSTVCSIGAYELGTEADRRAGDEKLSAAVDALCRTSGLLDFLSQKAVPDWEKSHPDGPAQLRLCRPPELSREATSGLARLALADAERLAIRRLLSRSAMDRHTTPGAGLPKSHPSPALLAKLELNVYQLYSAAKDALKLASGAGEMAGSVRDYVRDGRQVAQGRAYKWLAVDAGEQMSRHGEAIGWLSLARESMKAVCGGSVVVVRNGGLKSDRAHRRGKVEQELEEIDDFRKGYEQLNRTVTFEPIPPSATLLARVPGGRAALNARIYTLPPPLLKDFGSATGSGMLDWADSDDDDGPGASKEPAYALKDAYY